MSKDKIKKPMPLRILLIFASIVTLIILIYELLFRFGVPTIYNYSFVIDDGKFIKVMRKALEKGDFEYARAGADNIFINFSDYENGKIINYDEYVDLMWSMKYNNSLDNILKYENDGINDYTNNKFLAFGCDYYGPGIELCDIINRNGNLTVYLSKQAFRPLMEHTCCLLVIPYDENKINSFNVEFVEDPDSLCSIMEYIAPEYNVTIDKPVLYLYPENKMDIEVKLDDNINITCEYPELDKNNKWNVTALPNGEIYDKNNKLYNYLYWEADGNKFKDFIDFSEGYCIKGEDTALFLENILEEIGLNRKEANEFIIYWLPKMQNNRYNIISFQKENYTNNNKIYINPQPDNFLRVCMAFKASENFIQIEPQKFDKFNRNGFTAVEWGGIEIY